MGDRQERHDPCPYSEEWPSGRGRPRHSAYHPREGSSIMTSDALRTFTRRPLLALGLLLGSAGTVAAQGIVSGRVTDRANGSPVVGARVVVVGTSLTASTNADGRYRVTGVPARAIIAEIGRAHV